MGRSRSLPNSGAYLAQLIMIACLLGVPSLNAIPLPSLSSIPNQSSHIHSTPYLSKRMEIASLGTLGVRAKNTQAAHESINAEHAATALQKSTIAEGVNKAGATGVDVFPSTHADHPSTLHNLPDEDDPDDIFYDIEYTHDFGQDENGQIIPINPSFSNPQHPIKSLKNLPQQQGTKPLTPDLATGNDFFDLKHPHFSDHYSPPISPSHLTPSPEAFHPESPEAPTPHSHQQAIATPPKNTQHFEPDHVNSDAPITSSPPPSGRASRVYAQLQKTSKNAWQYLLGHSDGLLQKWRAKTQIAKPEQLDVKDAEQTTFTEPHNVIPTAEVHPSAKDKESLPVHESEPQAQSKDQRENPLGEKAANNKTTSQKLRFKRIFTKEFWSKLTNLSFWKKLFNFRKPATPEKAEVPVTANHVA